MCVCSTAVSHVGFTALTLSSCFGQVSGCSLSEEENKRSPPSLLRGDFDEEESTKSFQEALRQWRGGQTNGTADPGNDAAWTPAGPGELNRHHSDTHTHTRWTTVCVCVCVLLSLLFSWLHCLDSLL